MIVVRVELWSARTGKVTEIGRMRISNAGGAAATRDAPRGDYTVEVFRGRDTAALDGHHVNRTGIVRDWPRLDVPIWGLVQAALAACGYGRRR